MFVAFRNSTSLGAGCLSLNLIQLERHWACSYGMCFLLNSPLVRFIYVVCSYGVSIFIAVWYSTVWTRRSVCIHPTACERLRCFPFFGDYYEQYQKDIFGRAPYCMGACLSPEYVLPRVKVLEHRVCEAYFNFRKYCAKWLYMAPEFLLFHILSSTWYGQTV